MTTQQPSLPVIVIGGVYEYRGRSVIAIAVTSGDKAVRVRNSDGRESSWTYKDQLTGPISMPCPICGEMVGVSSPWGESLVKHMQKHAEETILTTPQDGEMRT